MNMIYNNNLYFMISLLLFKYFTLNDIKLYKFLIMKINIFFIISQLIYLLS